MVTMNFNSVLPTIMHIDLNSCFATVEQQANPLLRGKPVVVAAYTTAGGCILTASREAKKLGIATGMRVGEAKTICPVVVVLPSDPWKYRFINKKLQDLVRAYSPNIQVKSIDEMVVDFQNTPQIQKNGMTEIAKKIKQDIKKKIGDWLTVSIGIAPNRYLAKVASGLHKPDGLDVIDQSNVEQIFSNMQVEDLTGIKIGYGRRLRYAGITTALSLYQAPVEVLTRAFQSVCGYQWWRRIHGYEADETEFETKSIGHSYALHTPYKPREYRLLQILCTLASKMGRRLRAHGSQAYGMHVSCQYTDREYWHRGVKQARALYSNAQLYAAAKRILLLAPDKPVRILSVSSYFLSDSSVSQLKLYSDEEEHRSLTKALDRIEDRYGDFSVFSAVLLGMQDKIHDRIAFGKS